MILLTGKSLNERHRELNNKVNEAAGHGVLFEDVKLQTEKSDVDRLYKIKLADKYRNVQYIIETLKCGDNLYIAKALKCAWLCDEEFSNIINPDYLEENVFPEMSFRMKRKVLTMISLHVTNDRAAIFYTYCMNVKLPNIAVKFLLNTSEKFKIDVINAGKTSNISDKNMIALIGNSFTLADTVFKTLPKYTSKYLISVRYLYSVSNVEYLDLVEKHILRHQHELTWDEDQRLGLRISKHIIKNYKDRIISHPRLYINMLNKSMLTKYSSPDDVKCYAPCLLPAFWYEFWKKNFYSKHSFLLDIIPFQERLQYIKHIFTTNYPDQEFEMDIQFYHARLYNLMTKEEKEFWALKHVEAKSEHFDSGKDFLWYKFVSFDKAFVAIKKYVLVAADTDLRNEIVRVLAHSAQSNRELETLFNYYYQRHINEPTHRKKKFVDAVLSNHDYYNFDDECWNAFNKILHSMDVYDHRNGYYRKTDYTIMALIYAIIYKKELHIALKQYIDDGVYMKKLKQATDQLPDGKAEVVYLYLRKAYTEKIYEFNIDKYDDEVKNAVRKYITYLFDLMFQFHKPREEIPELIMKYVQLDFDEYKGYFIIPDNNTSLTQSTLVKDLKNDASLVVSKIPSVKTALNEDCLFRLNKLLRKIRVYFSTDIAVKYTELFKDLLTSKDICEKTCDVSVYGIFQIAEKAEKIDFATKYIPTESKIPHEEIERKLLYIRKAICKNVCVSRPVVPLVVLQKYIVGDYLKFCMPLIQSYAANLQPASLTDFVKFLLKSPASVEKHGLRLAFHCFCIKDLKEIISDIWKSTKNVSLRLVIYQAVYNKIIGEHDEDLQEELFETFNKFTLDVCEDDDDGFFKLLCKSRLPSHILGEHILSAWKALNALPEKRIITNYKSDIIENMAKNVNLMPQDVIESIVSEHVTFMLKQENIGCKHDCPSPILDEAKWDLVIGFLLYFPDEEAVELKLKIVRTILKECIRLWDKIDDKEFTIREFLNKFIEHFLISMSLDYTRSSLHGIRLLDEIVKELQEGLPLIEVYQIVWTLRITIIARNILVNVKDDGVMDDNLVFDKCVDRFASEFTNLLNEFIERRKYYLSAQRTIISTFKHVASCLFCALPNIEKKNLHHILTVVCAKLVEIEKFETYYFALDLLPTDEYYISILYQCVVDKMKSFNNDEIKHFLYRKLVIDNRYKLKKVK